MKFFGYFCTIAIVSIQDKAVEAGFSKMLDFFVKKTPFAETRNLKSPNFRVFFKFFSDL